MYYKYTVKCFSMVMILVCLRNSMVDMNVLRGVSVCVCVFHRGLCVFHRGIWVLFFNYVLLT